MLGCDLSESSPHLGLLDLDNLADMPLSSAVLVHYPAGDPFRCPEHGAADIGDGLALSNQLLRGFELADDLLGSVADAFYGEVPGPVWPNKDSH